MKEKSLSGLKDFLWKQDPVYHRHPCCVVVPLSMDGSTDAVGVGESHTTMCGTMQNAELINVSLDWRVFQVLEQAQFNPDSSCHYCMHIAVWSHHYVLTSKSKSSHTKYFSHAEGTLPLSCQSRHPPTDIMELVAELGNLPKTSFLNSKKLMFVISSDQIVQQAVQWKLKML